MTEEQLQAEATGEQDQAVKENKTRKSLSKFFIGKIANSPRSESPTPGFRPDEIYSTLQDHRDELDKIRDAADKLTRQVRAAFEKVKEELSKVQEGVDHE